MSFPMEPSSPIRNSLLASERTMAARARRMAARLGAIALLLGAILAVGCVHAPAPGTADWVQTRSSTRLEGARVAVDRSPRLHPGPHRRPARLVHVRSTGQLGLCLRYDEAGRSPEPIRGAVDAKGNRLPTRELGRIRLHLGPTLTTVCVGLEPSDLTAALDSGLELSLLTSAGSERLFVPREWIRGFLQYVDEASPTDAQLALTP